MVRARKGNQKRGQAVRAPAETDTMDDVDSVHSARDLSEGDHSMLDDEPDAVENDDGMDEDASSQGGDGDAMEVETPAVSIGPIPTGPKFHKTPMGEELRSMKDASELFQSSSFKLQIDALLPNVRPKPSRIPKLDRFLFALHAVISAIPSVAPQHPLHAARKLLKKGIAVTYSLPVPTEDTNWKVAFEPPTEITLVGSWANKMSVKAKDDLGFGVDLALKMPKDLFQEKDYLNGRFFHKRAFYLATVAAVIADPKSKLDVDVAYESLGDDPRLTKLILTPRGGNAETDFTKLNAKVYILPVLPADSPIPISRLSPSHSNLRISSSKNQDDESGTSKHQPTPLYNNALLRTLTPRPHFLAVHALQNSCDSLSDAFALLRIWAHQRGFGEGTKMTVRGFEGVGGTFWWSVLALLLNGDEPITASPKTYKKRRTVGKGLSSYQLFKASLEFLAKHDFANDAVHLKSAEGHRFPPKEFTDNFSVTFVDSTSLLNLLAEVPLGSLDLLKYQALKTLETLNRTATSGDPFVSVFLKDWRDLASQFDLVLRVPLASARARQESIHATLDAGSQSGALFSSLDSVLRRGLNDRCRAISLLHPCTLSRPLSQAYPSTPEFVFVGLVLDPQNAFRLVDHGPAAGEHDEQLVQDFRNFWGDKAELRRFKDGRIIDSVVWDAKTVDEKAHVPAMVVKHLLKHHFNIKESEVETWQASFDSILRLPAPISQQIVSSGVAPGFKSAITAFDRIVKSIKDLGEELPLSLLNISPVSESLRYTSVFTPVPLPDSLVSVLPPNARFLSPIEIVLEFEKSSRWPDDLQAIQVIKLAFFERIASALMSSVEGLKADVVTGDGVHDSELMDKSYLEIVTPEGWAFNARISHDRELTLLERTMGGKKAAMPHIVSKVKEKKTKEYYEAVLAKDVFLRRYVHAPRHHRAVATLCHHYVAYQGTVRLVKRWLASHWLLNGHISPEVVEILCAYVFVANGNKVAAAVDPEQAGAHLHPVPVTKERGFALVVQLLKDWNWQEGLFVPLYGSTPEAPSPDSPSLKLVGDRKGVWKVTTEYDSEGYVWTQDGPDAVVARRVRALADATWKCLEGLENGQLNVSALFSHPTDDYDFIIHLDPLVLPRYMHNVNADVKLLTKRGKYANRLREDDEAECLPGFDPAQLFFEDLKRIYADTFKIFYDPFGGDKFGCIWDPSVKESRPFRVLGGFSSVPTHKEGSKDKAEVVLNSKAILAEIERLGAGIVKSIVQKS